MTKIVKQVARTRRKFCAEFKREAVRRMAERRAQGVTVKQIGRKLDVRPEVLRAWERQFEDRPGVPLADVFPGQGQMPSDQAEMRRLQREVHLLRQENTFLKSAAVYSSGQCIGDAKRIGGSVKVEDLEWAFVKSSRNTI